MHHSSTTLILWHSGPMPQMQHRTTQIKPPLQMRRFLVIHKVTVFWRCLHHFFKAFQQQAAANVSQFSLNNITNSTVKREISKIGTVGIKLNESDNLQLSTLINDMTSIYINRTICAWQNGAQNCSVQWALTPGKEFA